MPHKTIWRNRRVSHEIEFRGNINKRLYASFMISNWKGGFRFRVGCLNSFSEYWGIGAVSSCLVPGLGWLGQEKSGPESKYFQLFKLDLEKAKEPGSNCQHPLDHWKSKRVPEKHLLPIYWIRKSLWLCGSQQTVENSERDENTRPPDLPPEKSVCRSGRNS